MKALIFLIITLKFQLQIYYTLAVTAESIPISSVPILIFLCIFITASSQCHILIFAPREKIRSNLEVKLYKMCPMGQGRSVSSENTQVKIGTSSLKALRNEAEVVQSLFNICLSEETDSALQNILCANVKQFSVSPCFNETSSDKILVQVKSVMLLHN